MKVENYGRSIFLNPLSLVLYARISIAVYGKYRAALRHIDCAFGANIDLLEYPLIHRRRDDGPPSPQRLLRNRGKVGRVRRIAATGLRVSTGAY